MVAHLTRSGRIVALLFALLSAAPSAQDAPVQSVEADIPTADVRLDGTFLFRIRGVSSYPAAERARLIEQRIAAAAADSSLPLDAFRIVEAEGGSRVMAGNVTLVTVVEADARFEQVARNELATAHLTRIREAVSEYRAARTPARLMRGATNALIITVIFVAAVAAVVWLWRRLDRFLSARLLEHGIRVQAVELLRGDRVWGALHGALGLVRTLTILGLVLVYASLIAAQFPWTRRMSSNAFGFALEPLQIIVAGVVHNLPSLAFLVVLFFVVRLALRLIRTYFDAVEQGTIALAQFDPEWAQPTYNIVRLAIIAFAVIVAYPYIPGSESAAFKGVSVFLGVLVSLGSTSMIANLIAGYTMIYRRAFKVGDRIKVGELMGDVLERGLQVTHLRSLKNESIVIPNSELVLREIVNYSALAQVRGLILHTRVGIGYETPWRQVEAMLLIAAERTPGLCKEPPPFVLIQELATFAVTYELNVFCRTVPTMALHYTDLHRRVLDVFNEHGVQIMTPAYEGDPERPKVVPRDAWYSAPADRQGSVERLPTERV